VSGPALRAVGLGKRFGRALALEALDFELAAGGSLAVLGPNGAGKSTLLRLLAGLTRPSSGSLTIAGTPAHRPAARAQVGFIGHASLLYASLTARENLLFAARLQRVREAETRVAGLLADFGLAGVADRLVAGFSRGMSQRLAIARGLVHAPGLLLLDEPFASLDPRAAAVLAQRLAGLRAHGCTLVLVTHDPRRACELAERALVLDGGRVLLERAAGPGAAEALERALLAAGGAAA
jgi:heme ABC exporter ATP-binding subunit CcmA